MRCLTKFAGLFILALIGAPLALPSVAGATTLHALTPQLTGPGHHVHTMANGESDVNACADNLGPKMAHCMARVRTAAGLAPMLGNAGAYDPAYLQSAYNAPSSNHGTGRTVAIVDAYDDPTAEADLAVYRTQFGLSACTSGNGCFHKYDESGGTTYPAADADWDLEIALDLDMVSAICPNCHIILVEANSSYFSDLITADMEAADLGADVISNSFGGTDSGYAAYYDDYLNLGVPITVSSGDSGYGVEFPASSKDVIAVGGTHLLQTGNTGTRNATETAWSGAGSGCASWEGKPAWQSDDCTGRTVADVSAVADPATPVWVRNGGSWYNVGGTSAAAPIVASFYALAAPFNGSAGSLLYNNAASLNDASSGSNGSCSGSYLCTAQAGYDGPTGLGTPNGITAFGGEPIAPSNTVPPSISGTAAVGASLLAADGTWTGTPTIGYSYQWKKCDAGGNNCADIANATDASYSPVGGDVGSTLRVAVTATNYVGASAPAVSNASDVIVTTLPPVNDVVPTIFSWGPSLALDSEGTWSGSDATDTTYQWQRCDANGDNCVDIDGETEDSYLFVDGDVGSSFRIVVTETNDAGSGAGYSDTYLFTGIAPDNAVPPVVSGSAVEGRTLTGYNGIWAGIPSTMTYQFQWYRCTDLLSCSAIAGATHSKYVVASGDVGKYLQLSVTATNSAGANSWPSEMTVKVVKGAPLNITLPKLSGTAHHGSTLKTSSGTWRGTATLSVAGYHWYRCNSSGTSCKAITGATKSSYVATLADKGHKLRAKVTEKNSIGSTSAMSNASATVT
jgi:hypothetical protein